MSGSFAMFDATRLASSIVICFASMASASVERPPAVRVVGMLYSTKRKLPRRRPTTRLILHRANANNQNIQALAAKEGCGSLSRTFQIFQEGVAEFAVIPRNARGRTQAWDDAF
jgi:hypothetical protein